MLIKRHQRELGLLEMEVYQQVTRAAEVGSLVMEAALTEAVMAVAHIQATDLIRRIMLQKLRNLIRMLMISVKNLR